MPYFDKLAAQHAVGFIERLQHTKGRWAGAPFKLATWQRKRIIEPLFGTMTDEGYRQYRTAYVEIPRKNGKSELAAAIELLLLFADKELGAEIYGAANDRDQAALVFDVAAEMVRRAPALAQRCKIIDSTKRIWVPKTNNVLRAIPADAAGSFGFNSHGVVFDELHTQKKRALWDALTTSTGAREQPLVYAMTTAGVDRLSVCYEQHTYAQQVAAGIIDDPTFLAVIYAASEDDAKKWWLKRVWRKCNPALDDFRSAEELRTMAKRAKYNPALLNTFLRLYLNIWTQQVSRWLRMDTWEAGGRQGIDRERLRNRLCFGGLDLGSVDDLTAWVLAFPDLKGSEDVLLLPRFWCPEAKLYDDTNQYAPVYRAWAAKGLLETTPGDATDFEYVLEQVLRDAAHFRIHTIGVDRWQAHHLSQKLQGENLDVQPIGQGFASMSAPAKEFQRLLLNGNLLHPGHPVLTWMADNVAVKQDAAGNLKPDKGESQGKIDGIVAAIMALDLVMRYGEVASVYERRGLRSVG